jgi:hypothetical protein
MQQKIRECDDIREQTQKQLEQEVSLEKLRVN